MTSFDISDGKNKSITFPQMPRILLYVLIVGLGIVLLLSTLIPWVLSSFILLAAGPAESVSINKSGMVTCPQLLTWTDWVEGSGDLSPHYSFLDRHNTSEAEIVGFRVGTDQQWFTQLTIYQAKYRYPDGRTELWAATGPKRLIETNRTLATLFSSTLFVLGIVCLVVAKRINPPT